MKDAILKAIEDGQDKMFSGKWGAWVDYGAHRIRVKIDGDSDIDPFRDYDVFGQIEDGSRNRPSGFDGAARKFSTRSGSVWWQPPEDVKGDPALLESIAERVREYFLEGWTYTNVWVEVEYPACGCCGLSKTDYSVLGGVESDAGDDYLVETVESLLSELIK